MSQVVGLPNNSYKPISNTAWVRVQLCKLQNGCTRLAAASDKVYQLLAHGRWFSPGTPASSTTKTGRHDIAEILLKVALKHQNQIKIKSFRHVSHILFQLTLPLLMPSLGIRCPLNFHILIFSETPSAKGSIYGRSSLKIANFVPIH